VSLGSWVVGSGFTHEPHFFNPPDVPHAVERPQNHSPHEPEQNTGHSQEEENFEDLGN